MIERPDGTEERIEYRAQSRNFVYGNTLNRGLYRVKGGAAEFQFTANLLNAAESDTSPRRQLSLEGGQQVEAIVGARADLEIWRWIAMSALAVLMFEWWYFHRRTV